MQAESPLTSVSFMHDGAAFAVGTTCGKRVISVQILSVVLTWHLNTSPDEKCLNVL